MVGTGQRAFKPDARSGVNTPSAREWKAGWVAEPRAETAMRAGWADPLCGLAPEIKEENALLDLTATQSDRRALALALALAPGDALDLGPH